MKSKLLIIAPTVPRYDQSSGDLRLNSIVDLLADSYDITFLYCGSSPSDEKYLDWLRERGVVPCNNKTSVTELMKTNRFSIAVIEFYFVAEYYLPRLKLLHPECRVIVDSVDVHFLRESLRADLTGERSDRKQAKKTRQRELNIYRKADLVVAVTEDDADAVRPACPGVPVGVVPNIHTLNPGSTDPLGNSLLFIGNFAHTPNVDAVLYFTRDVLPRIRAKVPDTTFTVVGGNPPAEIRALQCNYVNITGYVPDTVPYLHASRVSVAPLRYGAGMKGKIGEAMAHGIPVVTTSIGAQGMGVKHRQHILIADSAEGFAEAVVELMSNPSLYASLRENAARHIADHFTPDRVGLKMHALLAAAGERPPRKLKLSDKMTFAYEYIAGVLSDRLRPSK